jgi:hypothetical protein
MVVQIREFAQVVRDLMNMEEQDIYIAKTVEEKIKRLPDPIPLKDLNTITSEANAWGLEFAKRIANIEIYRR